MADPRFARLRTDPRFRKPQKQTQKVVLDDRFKSLLDTPRPENENESGRRLVDKYGRKLSSKHDSNNLRRFYRLQGEDKEQDSKDTIVPDLARGEVVLESSDESADEIVDSDPGDDDGEVVLGRHVSKPVFVSQVDEYTEVDLNEDESAYAELDAQAEAIVRDQNEDQQHHQEATKTNRLAVVNLDWDHVRAAHLYKIFSSLLSRSHILTEHDGASGSKSRVKAIGQGKVLSVRVYPSEFGKARMKKEDIEGPPKEIFKKSRRGEEAELLEEDEGDEYDEDALRKYQLERLRYYYAIVTCDTVEAAAQVHVDLDGTELERSANVFDLSFVPNDMTFDDEFRDEATPATVVGSSDYKGLDFSTDALRHSKVKLHWDEDDVERNKITRRTLSRKEIEEENFKALVASASESSDNDEEISRQSKNNRIKLRELLLSGSGDDVPEGWSGDPFRDDKPGDGDVEITFMPALSERKPAETDETTLDRYKRKMKEKRLQRKRDLLRTDERSGLEKKPVKGNATVAADEFFGEDNGHSETNINPPGRSEATTDQLKNPVGASGDEKNQKHFSLKAVLKAEKNDKRKKIKHKKAADQGEDETQEQFQIDVKDDRFKALHEDHTFAIDPSNPHFKKTKSMIALLDERTRRQNGKRGDSERPLPNNVQDNREQDLQGLVESVKRKSAATEERQKGKRQRVRH